MLSGNYKTYTVGHIVAERFETAQVFARHGNRLSAATETFLSRKRAKNET